MSQITEEEFFKTAPVFGGGNATEPERMPASPISEEEFFKSSPQYAPPSAGTPTPATSPTPTAQQNPAVSKALFLTTGREPPPDMSWSDVGSQALQNAPKSAWEFGKSIVQPFLSPIETGKTVAQLGQGLVSKGKGLVGLERDVESEGVADAMGQFFKERYGDMPSFMRTLSQDPVGAAADFASVLTLGGGALAKAPSVIGKVGEAAKAVGTAVDPLSLVTKAPAVAAKAATSVLNYPLSLQSGASYNSLQQATKAGLTSNPVFMEHLSGAVPPTDLVKRINDGIQTVAKQRSDEYLAGMGSIASNQRLPYDKVDNALKAARDVAYYKGQVRNPEAAAILQQMESTVSKWRSDPSMTHNIADFDALKQALRSYGYSSTYKGTPARKIVDDISNAAKNTIPDKRYAQIMENYQSATQELTDLTKELTARGGSSIAQIRKILRSQDTKAKGDLIKRLEEIDPNLPYAIAGVELNPLLPQGIRGQIAGVLASGSLGGLSALAMHPAPLAGLAFSSPKVSGLTAYGLGRVGGISENVRKAYPSLAPAVFQSGRADQVLEQASGGRVGRASGGRLNGASRADMIIAQVDKARKELQRETGSLLNHDDSTIVKALKVANERI